ncbi:MAG: TlpA family protein disulfide reductase [Actinomycetota bacterium]|nr:TlpA family protein disulfide reductase [Actinomycetota bacterium]
MEATVAAPSKEPNRLRAALILTPCLLFVGLLTYGLIAKGDAPRPGDQAPAFQGPLLEGGGTLALEDLEGRPVFINFWGSWCEPCKDEAPALKRAQKVYGDEVAFVGINIRDAHDDAVAFAEAYGLDYQHVRDESLTIYGDYGLTGQPESFFIDRDGEVVEHVAGPVDEESLARSLDVLVTRGG